MQINNKSYCLFASIKSYASTQAYNTVDAYEMKLIMTILFIHLLIMIYDACVLLHSFAYYLDQYFL